VHLSWTIPSVLQPMLVLVVVAAGLWTRRHYRMTTPQLKGTLGRLLPALRWVSLILIILAVAGPLMILERTESDPARVILILDDSQSMEFADLPDGVTRWDGALTMVAALDSVLDSRSLTTKLEVWRGSGLAEPEQVLNLTGSTQPASQGTDLSGLVDDVLRSGGARPRLVALFSDGHQTVRGPASDHPRLENFWAAGFGDPHGPGDRWIRDVRAPDLAFVGDEIVIEVAVGLREPLAGNRSVTVVLELAGEEKSRVVADTDQDDTTLHVVLKAISEQAGLQELTIRIEPGEEERYLSNNVSHVAIQVREEQSHLLLLSSHPDWTVRFLSQAGTAEQRINLDVVHPSRQGPALAGTNEGWIAPQTMEQWLEYDGIVLTDSDAARSWIDEPSFTSALQQGLGLMVVDGEGLRSWPTWIKSLLPVSRRDGMLKDSGQLVWRETGHPASTGLRVDNFDGSRLPPASPIDQVQAAPLAHVLAVVEQIDNTEAPVLVVSGDSDQRVVWLGLADLWEQAFWTPRGNEDGHQPVRRLLRNLLVWTGQGQDLFGQSLLAQRIVYQEGEPIAVRARGRGLRGKDGTTPSRMVVQALSGTGEPRHYSLVPDPARPAEASVMIPPLSVGRHRLQLLDQQGELAGAPLDIIVAPGQIESRQTTQNTRNLRSLAESFGGQSVDATSDSGRNRLLTAVSHIDLTPEQRVVRSTLRPWSTWPALLLIVSLLGLEWFLRRRAGLL
jgi:hypothetical protein